MKQLSAAAKAFVIVMTLAGLSAVVYGAMHWKPANWFEFTLFLVLALAASRLRVKLPGMNGTMAMNLPFFLIVVADLSPAEALVIALLSGLAQSISVVHPNRPVQIVFNIATLVIAVAI